MLCRMTVGIMCVLLLLGYFVTALDLAYSQSTSATLTGTVVDETGAVVPDVRIQATNLDTVIKRATITNGSGNFTLPLLPPGAYSVLAERDGFSPFEIKDLVLNVNDQQTVRIQLRVGGLGESVTVESTNPVVQSQGVEISGLVSEQRVKELPLNGKDFNKLLLLAPGVGGGSATNPAVSGARSYTNNYTIDGSTANDERTPNGIALGGGAGSNDFGDAGPNAGPNLISTEAVLEYRVITSNADATFGRGSGGQIDVVTKSGSNQFHGSAYEFLRNDALDARDFFNYGPFLNSDGSAKVPPFKQHLFGASIGGPVIRNRHFFFGNYEGYRQKLSQTASTTVPNAALIGLIPGDLGKLFRTFFIDRGIVPATGNPGGTFNPLSAANRNAAVAAGFPAALFDGSLANGEAGTVLISGAPTRDVNQDSFLIRTDHRLSDRLTASVRYAFAQPLLTNASATRLDVSQSSLRWQSGLAQLVYTLSPTQILEVHGAFQRTKMFSGPEGGSLDPRLVNAGVSAQFGINLTANGTGISQLQLANSGFIDNQTIPQGSLMHTLTRGNLTLRSGVDLRYVMTNVANVSAARPNYTFSGFVGANGILGTAPGQAQAIASSAAAGSVFGLNGGPTSPMRGWRSMQHEYFAQADWRIRRDVTLNGGLRYSYFGVYHEVNNGASNLYAVDSSGKVIPDASPFKLGLTANQVAQVSDGRPFYQPDRNNFQPRIGAAWDIGGRGRTILRSGYGLYVDRIYQIEFSGNVTNVPLAISSSAANVPFQLGMALPLNPNTSPPQLTLVDPTLRDPYTHRFNAAIEQRLGADTSITAAYVGARGRDLLRYVQPNGAESVPQSARPDPRFSRIRTLTNYSTSDYNALQLFLKRRFARGVDFTVSYTYGRSRDDSSTDLIFGIGPTLLNISPNAAASYQDAQFVPRPRLADYGNSDFDVRHNLTISHLIELPFGRNRRFLNDARGLVNGMIGGWSLAGVALLRSGEPVNVTLGNDVNHDGSVAGDRPALLKGSIDDLYARGSSGRIQYLVTLDEAATRLGVPNPVTDPFASIRRNSLHSPSVTLYDLSLLKHVPIRENISLRFEVNAFNVFNHENLDAPVADLTDPLFGQSVNTRFGTNPRQIQLGVKLTF